MEIHKPISTIEEPLAEQIWYRDWDQAASFIDSLKIYMSDFGTMPVWNMHLCGGRPEIALPHSLAFQWYTPFLYFMQSYIAIIVIWIFMSLIGGTALYFLLKRWTGSRAGAFAGTLLYFVSGFYGSHYNQGHIWWASHHFFPVFLLFFDKAVSSGRSSRTALAAIAAATWGFFTAALPHGLFYLYPAFIIYVAVTLFSYAREKGLADTRARFTTPLIAHVFGIFAAMYKLIPVVVWQSHLPRRGVLPESITPVDVVMNSLRFVSDYYGMFDQHFENQIWFAWEYSWYIGLAPWLLLVLVCTMYFRNRKTGESIIPTRQLVFALLLLVSGMWLAMGNGNAWSPSSLFKYIPLVKGIRTFGRFQVLCLLGLTIISAYGIAWLQTKSHRKWIFWLFVGATVGPGLAQTAVLAVRIGGVTDGELEKAYELPQAEGPGLMAVQGFDILKGMTVHAFLLRKGYWVLDCYDPMNFKRPSTPGSKIVPITTPPPESVQLTWRGAIFRYPQTLTENVVFNGPVYDGFWANHPYTVNAQEKWEFKAEDLRGRSLEIKAPVHVEKIGFTVSAVSALLGFILLLRRKDEETHGAG